MARHLAIRQSRFYASGQLDPSNPNKQLWPLPLAVAYPRDGDDGSGIETASMVLAAAETVYVELPAPVNVDRWIKVNAGQAGYYRVLYDARVLHAMVNDLAATPSILPGAPAP